MWLFTTFEVNLSEPVLVKAEVAEPLVIGLGIEGFDVEAVLFLKPGLGRIKKGSDEQWHYAASALEVTVSRNDLKDEGVSFRDDCLPEYQRIAKLAANKLVLFLEYKLWHPLFYAIEKSLEDFATESDWQDKNNLAVSLASEEQLEHIQSLLNMAYGLDVSKNLLEMARLSISQQRVWKACLEIAAACEISNKECLPQRFESEQLGDSETLEQLLQFRDKAAHAGDGLFKNRTAANQQITLERLQEFFQAAAGLIMWLEGQGEK